MARKLPLMKARHVVRALERAGFYIHHQRGSHVRLLHRLDTARRVTVPMHGGDVPPATLHRILQQAKLTIEEFSNLV